MQSYFHCVNCDLIFLTPKERLSAETEKTRYDMHENEESPGYRQFLEPLILEIENHTRLRSQPPEQTSVLDYGCGPTAFLSKLLAEKSYVTENYDIFYFTNQNPLQRPYDVIVCTEVWEHLFHPLEEIEQLVKLLNPGGLLAVMTSAHQGLDHFADWYYRRDPTHVVFFSEVTMTWIAAYFQLKLTKAQSPYWIFQK